MRFSGGHLIWLTAWSTLVATVFMYFHWNWMEIPIAPITIIGTAVAFYIGFKNNQAYDRLWEARKIWGAIVNDSRTWGASINAYISNLFVEGSKYSEEEIYAYKKTLIYRHIAWLYALRSQLLLPTQWEHISQSGLVAKTTEQRMKTFGVGLLDDDNTEKQLRTFLVDCDYDRLINYKNTATQIIEQQSQDLAMLREKDLLDDFRQTQLQGFLKDFYTHQGKCERIKKFPLPRQYASMSVIFVGIFIFLLPFCMVNLFHIEKLGLLGHFLCVPFTVLISWIYLIMELVGDYSENPFEGLGNDIPMLSLCRTIEIDLREMLDETELPDPIKPINGVLM